ncbi:Xanthine/uracil/vitamin C permease [Gluconacetobacter diazotrophicus PA1 5]|uniref:NCS2 family permease n=2 Tax=Gluconacetobacter diazotrophicus TaxID=33996 RepID=A0A7W4I590_GLUDI|nr:NCS2 family permease [Gluconacetobacter diazotrophicus]ACI50252.1 Xanthine/uracil/vitamin C permease [Gluconacetobacter diazotrophicus PA1 5]MBB2154835.1 NCS2 family permease [Gluconacetobacter diazotrophicus]TWB07992.1 AGZA family xanthine/uracil permease-like MFS transporter [Gluconacetobacter diazotrophicus]CAP56181.1 putative permease protein [Gluconacetobacter diazotrophicus PA1 5]
MRHDGAGVRGWIDRTFHVTRRGSTLARELVAGLTTFGAMAYIMIVNPAIMALAGLDRHDMIMTTIAASVCGSLLMALMANLPIALAPAMSSNLVFAQVVVVQMGVKPSVAFTMVLIGGLAFVALSLTRWRQRIVMGFPIPVRNGIHCAIGAFIAHIGMVSGGLAVGGAQGFSFGSLHDPAVLLGLAGLFLAATLQMLRVPAGMLLSIVAVTVAGCFVRHPGGHPVTTLPAAWLEWPHYPTNMLFPFDFHGFLSHIGIVLPVTIYFFLGDFFDATGTMMAVTRRAGLTVEDGQPLLGRAAFAADGTASVIGSVLGTSTVSAYLESLVGAEAGGRTGLVGVTVALLFLLSSVLWPVITAVPAVATAPVLVLVGLGMLSDMGRSGAQSGDGDVGGVLAPLLMVLVTVMTGNFMVSLALGLLLYTVLAVAGRRWAEVTPILLALDAVFVVYLVLASGMGGGS